MDLVLNFLFARISCHKSGYLPHISIVQTKGGKFGRAIDSCVICFEITKISKIICFQLDEKYVILLLMEIRFWFFFNKVPRIRKITNFSLIYLRNRKARLSSVIFASLTTKKKGKTSVIELAHATWKFVISIRST